MLRKISPIFQTVTNRRPPTPKGKVFRHFPLLFFKYFPHQNGHCADAAEIYLRAVAFLLFSTNSMYAVSIPQECVCQSKSSTIFEIIV